MTVGEQNAIPAQGPGSRVLALYRELRRLDKP